MSLRTLMVSCFAGGALLTILLTVVVDHLSGFRHVRNHPMRRFVEKLHQGEELARAQEWTALQEWSATLRFHGKTKLAFLPTGAERKILAGHGDPRLPPDMVARAFKLKTWIHHIEDGEIQFYHPVLNSDGAVIGLFLGRVAAPKVDIMAVWSRAFLVFLLASVAVVSLAGLVGLWLGQRIASPLGHLVRATTDLANGRYHRLPCGNSPAEFEHLSRSFNEMSVELQDKIERLAKAKLAAERAQHSRRDFLADVSHSLGTPLTSIHGWLEAIRQGLVPKAEMPSHLDKLTRQVEFVSKTSRRLLELSLWESVAPPLVKSEFALLDPVLEVAETLEEQLLDAGIHLNIEGLSPHNRVRGDRGHLREIFQVFVENAVEHSGGDCELTITAQEMRGRMRVTVSDDGKGMTPQQALAAQERYYSRRGSGLGLAIATRLVQAHQGSLTVLSHPGRGAQFQFDLALPHCGLLRTARQTCSRLSLSAHCFPL